MFIYLFMIAKLDLSLNSQFRVWHQKTNQWLTRDQVQVHQVELTSEVKERSRKEKLRDLKHYLWQDQRFAHVAQPAGSIRPGRPREKILEEFWTMIYSGLLCDDPDLLCARGRAPTDCLHLLDEVEEDHRPAYRELRLGYGL
jgi:hypothetical protein